ncbi:MAG TPA: SUMF1/EgtB/PvdO family nonheme iron enzyme [Polyangiaceae bacterium]
MRAASTFLVPATALLATLLLASKSTSTSAGHRVARVRPAPAPPCPADMELIGKFCIDRFEASTEEVRDDGSTAPHSPFLPVTGVRVRAVSRKSVVPQAYISRNESEAACKEAGKRLCADGEWVTACKGPTATKYPYGDERKDGYCVDTHRVSPLDRLFLGLGSGRYLREPMNDPRLNQVPGTLAATGAFSRCTNGFHVYDMVGNVHEWTADPNGTFRGGYYLDTRINGEGCEYRTVAHPATYHDYSTGFRCCADPR